MTSGFAAASLNSRHPAETDAAGRALSRKRIMPFVLQIPITQLFGPFVVSNLLYAGCDRTDSSGPKFAIQFAISRNLTTPA